MQALRQLYVLACQKRIMRAIDVNIRQPVYVPVTLAMASEHPTTQQGSLEVSRNENEPLNTPSSAPAACDDKVFHVAAGVLQACMLLMSACCFRTALRFVLYALFTAMCLELLYCVRAGLIDR